MLAWLNVHPIVQQRGLLSTLGPQAAAMMLTAQHHNQVGIAAGWVTQYRVHSSESGRSSGNLRVASPPPSLDNSETSQRVISGDARLSHDLAS